MERSAAGPRFIRPVAAVTGNDLAVRFAAVTDLHFGRAAPFRGVNRKVTDHAPSLTAAFVADMNRRVRPDFVVVLGDVIEDESPQADLDNYAEAAAILSGLEMPVRYVYGNHDLVNLTHDQLLAISGEAALNSSFDLGGWHLVRLHSTATFTPAGPHGSEHGLVGRVTPEHLDWLDRDLAMADRPAIVFTHFSAAEIDLAGQFWFEDSPDEALLANRAEVRAILESHNVAMVLNGHVHWNNHTVHNGISYITIQSLVENATGDGEPAAAWALIEAGAECIDVTVGGRDPARYRTIPPRDEPAAERSRRGTNPLQNDPAEGRSRRS